MTRRATRYWQTVGRLRAGQSIEAAQADMHAIARRLEEVYPNDNRGWSVQVMPFDKAMVRDVREALWILMGAVAFVIVIACANVAGLILARSVSRRREVMTRLALGAFFEVLPNTALTSLNRFRERVTLDSTVLLFTVAISMFTRHPASRVRQ